jgi:hypothetical protein
LDAQQPLGVLGVDAAQFGEYCYDLHEQEPAGQPEETLGMAHPLPNTCQPSTALRVPKFKPRTSHVSQEMKLD